MIKRIYLRLLRDYFAGKIIQGLMSNPERYKYIAKMVENGGYTQEQATDKNVNKAYLMADQMIKRRNK